jgi:hypothetical protein
MRHMNKLGFSDRRTSGAVVFLNLKSEKYHSCDVQFEELYLTIKAQHEVLTQSKYHICLMICKSLNVLEKTLKRCKLN